MEHRCLGDTQYICCPEAPVGGARSAIAVPLACQSGNLGMLYIENDAADPAYDENSLNVFSALACCVARPVENTLHKTAVKRQAVMSTEQTIARVTQDALTPRAVPQWDDLQLAAYRHMGVARCSDFYDIVQLPDKTASIIVARLGVEGMVTPRYLAEVRTGFRGASLHADPPHLFCRSLNWLLFSDGRFGVDLVNVWIAPKSGRVTYCAAGEGVRMRRIGANGGCSALQLSAAPPIGRSRAPAYESASIDLAPGDAVMLATSGIDSATGADGKPFGIAALQETLADAVGGRPGSMLSEFESDFTEFVSGGACPDDVTVLLARWK
jgi:hypothetical protein